MNNHLKKIVVKNVGVLKAFNTPSSPQLERLTSFYARNGRGKTTLSAILRSAGTNKPSIIIGRRTLGQQTEDPDVTLVFENGNVRFEKGRWLTPIPLIEVFDGTFIADNLYAGEAIELSNDRSLFTVILGKAGVKLAKQQEFFVGSAKRAAQRLSQADGALAHDIPTDLTREAFFAYSPSYDLDAQIEQAEKDLNGVLQADRLSRLKRLQPLRVPSLDLGLTDVLTRTVSDIDITARERLASHFKKFNLGKQGEAWIKFGLEHIHDNECPFCAKPEVEETGLIAVYGQIFGDTYKAHFDSIKEAADRIDQTIGPEMQNSISALFASNVDTLASLSEFYALGEAPLPSLDAAVERIGHAHHFLKTLFDAKRQSPLVSIDDAGTLTEAAKEITSAAAAIVGYNEAVDNLNKMLEKKRLIGGLTEQQARERVSNLRRRKNRTNAGVQTRIRNYLSEKARDDRAKKIRSLVQSRLKEKNQENAGHYYTRVNFYLQKFGAKFRISEIKNSMSGNTGSVDYGLIVRGHKVARGRGRDCLDEPTFMNTLSTGDKTTLAFAFFLAALDRQSADSMKERIIVFDDPLSSHDTHRRGTTVDLLHNLCGRCGQIIVLSHDADFLRRVHRRCNQWSKVAYQIEFDGPEDWSAAQAADLEELCRSGNSQRLGKLCAYFQDRTGLPSDVAPAVRTVLETHYRSAYPAYFGANENLGQIVKSIREQGPSHPCWEDCTDLESCNVRTLEQHHGDDPQIPAAIPIDPDELHEIVRTCLLLIHAIAPEEASTRSIKTLEIQ